MQQLALRWTAIDPAVADTTLQAFRQLGVATDWTSFRAALLLMVCPSQNFVFASANDGTVGYQLPGKIPIRAPGHTGEYPVPGNVTTWQWQGALQPPLHSRPMRGHHLAPRRALNAATRCCATRCCGARVRSIRPASADGRGRSGVRLRGLGQ